MGFESNLKVIYILDVGTDADGLNIYHFLCSEDCEATWGEGWENKPACVMRDLTPDATMYSNIYSLKTELVLDLAQNNCCFSMQDCRDNIVALASENLENAEEYPDEGRIVIHFGNSLDDVVSLLGRRQLELTEWSSK